MTDLDSELETYCAALPLPVSDALDISHSCDWLAAQFDKLTTQLVTMKPSVWAEERRYLPPSATAIPGPFRFDVTPFAREIIDCFDVESPIREVAWMKGVQISATTNLENLIGYGIDYVKTAPMMLVTADAELANLRLTSYILPMLHESGLSHLIVSSDPDNSRKTGKTDKKLEFQGGGFLIPFGAQNANKLRSMSIRFLFRDEIDAWPDVVGKDGDPIKLSMDRTAAFEETRKVFDASTPTIEGQSKIYARFKRGDQRYYHVRCLKCRFAQPLRWKKHDADTGITSGIVWKTDEEGRLVPGSVRYRCQACGHAHTNDDKTRLMAEDNAEWRPTATPVAPHVRSYHLSALYSPSGMQSWEACVMAWMEAWDDTNNRVRDVGKLQVFYNNILGEPFKLIGDRVKFETVSAHRRHVYRYGVVPNSFATEFCEGPIVLLTCAVDVQQDYLSVAVWGWTRGRRVFLVDYFKLEGDTENSDSECWEKLREFLETKRYYADDDADIEYLVDLTLVDSGFRTETVYQFCSSFERSVFPCKGVEMPQRGARIKEFALSKTQLHGQTYAITANLYKDRWHAALKRHWNGQDVQPAGHFNVPSDTTDKQLKELTAETKVEKIDPQTGRRLGWTWNRSGGVRNELWDLLIYGSCALDILAWAWHLRAGENPEAESVDWFKFFDALEKPFKKG